MSPEQLRAIDPAIQEGVQVFVTSERVIMVAGQFSFVSEYATSMSPEDAVRDVWQRMLFYFGESR